MLRSLLFSLVLGLPLVQSAHAQDTAAAVPSDVKGLFLLSDYPALTVRAGTTATINLKLQNYGLAPQRLALSVAGVPDGWKATLLGGGQPIAAAMPVTGANVAIQLRLDLPKTVTSGTQTLTINAEGDGQRVSLPVQITVAQDLPAKLSLDPELPALRGTARSSFEFRLAVKNDSGKDVVASLRAEPPKGFDASFTEAYGTQELTSVPVKAGESKTVKMTVKPPSTTTAGIYPVNVTATADDATVEAKLSLEVTGQAQLRLGARDDRLSTQAVAGKETSLALVLSNDGGAPAEGITMSGSPPSGWTLTFDPKEVPTIAPGQKQEVQAKLTPADKAIAGDYMVTIRANSARESANSDFRVTVTTSTIWGVAGIGIVAIALLVMFGAVMRFGRR